MRRTASGIYLFNIVPRYRPKLSDVFDYARTQSYKQESWNAACLPSFAQRVKQNTLFTDLENIAGDGLTSLDLLYVFATDADRDFAKINWVDPGSFTASEVSAPTFTQNEGFQGNGSDAYLDTGWDPDTNGDNYTQDEAGWFIFFPDAEAASDTYAFGASNASNVGHVGLKPRRSLISSSMYVNSEEYNELFGELIKFFHCHRDETTVYFYHNGTLVGSIELAANGLTSQDIAILAARINGSITGHSNYPVGLFGLGASLAGSESDLYTAWNEYFTSL